MTLALVAGRGDLPALVAAGAQTPPLVCGYEGIAISGLDAELTFRLETLGTLLLELGNRGITEVCFAGALARPALDPSKLDAETAPLVPLFMEALKSGDDGALRVLLDLFEKTGFNVVGAHEIVPGLLAQGGVYGAQWPDAQMREDATVAAKHIFEMSPQDKGQACVAAKGRVIAMEDARARLICQLSVRKRFKRSMMQVCAALSLMRAMYWFCIRAAVWNWRTHLVSFSGREPANDPSARLYPGRRTFWRQTGRSLDGRAQRIAT